MVIGFSQLVNKIANAVISSVVLRAANQNNRLPVAIAPPLKHSESRNLRTFVTQLVTFSAKIPPCASLSRDDRVFCCRFASCAE